MVEAIAKDADVLLALSHTHGNWWMVEGKPRAVHAL
jgi:hypothetical protein